jgi:hypothetical protein
MTEPTKEEMQQALDRIGESVEKMKRLDPETRKRVAVESAELIRATYVLRNMMYDPVVTVEDKAVFRRFIDRLIKQEEQRILAPVRALDQEP